MSGNELAIRREPVIGLATVESIGAMAKLAAMSGLVKSSGKTPEQRTSDAFVVMTLGVELGMPPMTSLQSIHVVNGTPTCSGQAMVALMKSGGCLVDIPDPSTVTDSATISIKHPNSPVFKPYTFTVDMAKKAGLWGSATWKKYPEMMLIWRAVSMGARMEAPDMISGMYTVEEIAPNVEVDEGGAVVGDIVEGILEEVKPEPTFDPIPDGKALTVYVDAVRFDKSGATIKTRYGYLQIDVQLLQLFVVSGFITDDEIIIDNVRQFADNEKPYAEFTIVDGDLYLMQVDSFFDTYPPIEGHPEDPDEQLNGDSYDND